MTEPSGRSDQEANVLDKEVIVFISYHRSDAVIAEAIEKTLTEIDRNRIGCFLDSQSIDSGQRWERILVAALKKADWLVCIFTGEQREYCGYEIGVFCEAHGLSIGHNVNSRVVCLHDIPKIPSVFGGHQHQE